MADTSMGAYSDPNTTPPMGQAIPLGAQHVLAMFASNVTPSIIVAGAAGLAFGSAEVSKAVLSDCQTKVAFALFVVHPFTFSSKVPFTISSLPKESW